MTPDQRIHRNLERICKAAGVSMIHCTEDQLAVMREIADWVERYTSGGHPVSVVARRAIANAER